MVNKVEYINAFIGATGKCMNFMSKARQGEYDQLRFRVHNVSQWTNLRHFAYYAVILIGRI